MAKCITITLAGPDRLEFEVKTAAPKNELYGRATFLTLLHLRSSLHTANACSSISNPSSLAEIPISLAIGKLKTKSLNQLRFLSVCYGQAAIPGYIPSSFP